MEALSAAQIAALAQVINQSNLMTDGPSPNAPGTLEAMRAAVGANQKFLPAVYQEAFSAHLLSSLEHLSSIGNGKTMMQVGVEAVTQHAPDSPVAPELRRLVIVIADLYNTFVHDINHTPLNQTLIERLAPLASFMKSASMGPFTITADTARTAIDSEVAVVSLPSAFRSHPLIWSTVSHETGGHDVIRANPGLLNEMRFGVYRQLAGEEFPGAQPSHQQKMGLLWAYWMGETSADVYALMNMGPAFILGALAFFSAYLSQSDRKITVPRVRTDSGVVGKTLDPHPTDVLRIGVAQGAINALTSLSPSTRQKYIQLLDDVTALVAPGVTHVSLNGNFNIQADDNYVARVQGTYKLTQMMQVAQQVGEYVAGATFKNLSNQSIQAIETWDNEDEALTNEVTHKLLMDEQLSDEVRPTMLLASAILAAVQRPDNYLQFNRTVEKYLDRAIDNSPIWSRQ